jgi:competence protein ComEC
MRFLHKIITISLVIIMPVFFSGCTTMSRPGTAVPEQKIKGYLAVHFINVGQGDSTFITSDSGENVLVDVGSPSGGPDVVIYLKKLGVKKIDHVILTHPHDDHIGGIFSLISEFEVSNFYDNGFSNFRSTIFGEYIKVVRADLSKYHVLQAGETIETGSLKIDVLNPLLPPAGNLNEDSIVLRLSFGDMKVLLSGDLGQVGERRLLKVGTELESHVLKIGHHGENDVCSEKFLSKVRPDAAIISVATINKYARPHPELLSRLEKAEVKIYRTDLNGDIVIRSDGKSYSINQ